MKNYFKLYEEYTRPRQFLFDVEISDSDAHQENREEKYAHDWECNGERVLTVEGSWDEEDSDIEIQLVNEKGVKTTKLRAITHYEIGPITKGEKDFATLEVDHSQTGGQSKEYDVKEEYIKGLEDYGSLMQSILTMYEHTFTRHGHYSGKDYGIS
jgi:hypothetical protein